MPPSVGFPPIARSDARILILGSLPSERSILEGQYYAHPQNAFWRIMREILGAKGSYEKRCEAIIDARIAVWDALHQSVRPGSMDADIQPDSSEPNDFSAFLEGHQQVRAILFNGKKAEQMFLKFVKLDLQMRLALLPSTSPAYASMPFAQKLEAWRKEIEKGRKEE